MKYILKATDNFWNTPIDEIEFSTRAKNVLKRLGCFTIGKTVDILEEYENKSQSIRNCGEKTMHEIKGKIYGFYLENVKFANSHK